MKNPFAGLKKKQVKLQFSTCGEIMIDGLPFAFGVESAGKASDKGLCVSISGEAVNDGRVTFSLIDISLTGRYPQSPLQVPPRRQ